MAIPSTRAELLEQITTAYRKLKTDLDRGGPAIAGVVCVDDWTVKDLLAVRVWWTTSVVQWIERGGRGEPLDLPAPGYSWKETPRLNAAIVANGRDDSYEARVDGLEAAYQALLTCIERLDDPELLEVGAFPWAGSYPVSRWISINGTRQYATARTYVRRAMRELGLT